MRGVEDPEAEWRSSKDHILIPLKDRQEPSEPRTLEERGRTNGGSCVLVAFALGPGVNVFCEHEWDPQ